MKFVLQYSNNTINSISGVVIHHLRKLQGFIHNILDCSSSYDDTSQHSMSACHNVRPPQLILKVLLLTMLKLLGFSFVELSSRKSEKFSAVKFA